MAKFWREMGLWGIGRGRLGWVEERQVPSIKGVKKTKSSIGRSKIMFRKVGRRRKGPNNFNNSLASEDSVTAIIWEVTMTTCIIYYS